MTSIDQNVLDSLVELEEGDTALVSQLTQMFKETASKTLNDMESLAKDNWQDEQIKKMAHSMRSSCGNLGIKSMAEAFEKIEYEELTQPQLQSEIESLKKEFSEATQQLESYIASKN